MIVTGDFCQFIIVVPHIEYSDRMMSIALMEQRAFFTPVVQSSITNYYSELTYLCHSLASHTERYCLASVSPYTERLMCFRFKTYDERYCCTIFMTSKYYHCNPIIQAVPNPSEMICFVKSFGNITERECFVEIRELLSTIQPISVSNSVIIRSLKEGFANVLLLTNKNLDLYIKGAFEQIVSEIDFSEHIIRSEDNVIEISGVDKTGGKISLDATVTKTLFHSSPFDLNVTVEGFLYQEISWQVAPLSSSSSMSSSSGSYSFSSSSFSSTSLTPPDGLLVSNLLTQVEVEVSGGIDEDIGPDGIHIAQLITQVEISEE